MNYQLQINEAFFTYIRRMDKIYQELNSLKESYSPKQYELLLEGFWDRVKSMAGQAGGAVGSAVGKTSNAVKTATAAVNKFGSDVYDKGVELGKKAIDVSKDLLNKLGNAINSGIEAIKAAPGQLWDNVVALSTSIGSEIAEIYKKAKEKGGEWLESAKNTATQAYQKLASGLSLAYNSVIEWGKKNAEEFKNMLSQKSAELKEAADSAKQSSFEGMKSIGEFISENFTKIKDKTIDVAKYAAILTLGLVALPFYATYIASKKIYEFGDELVDSMKSGIETLKKNLGETWDIAVSSYKQAKDAETSKLDDPAKESYIIKKFENFKY